MERGLIVNCIDKDELRSIIDKVVSSYSVEGNIDLDIGDLFINMAPVTLDEAPYDVPLALISKTWEQPYYNDITTKTATFETGAVVTKLSVPTKRRASGTSPLEVTPRMHTIVPSVALSANDKNNFKCMYVGKQYISDALFVPLENISKDYEPIISKKTTVIAANLFSLSDVISSSLTINFMGINNDDVEFILSTNKNLQLKIESYLNGKALLPTEVIDVNWLADPIQSAQDIIEKHIQNCTSVPVQRVSLEGRLNKFYKDEFFNDQDEFEEKLYELVPEQVLLTGAVTPKLATQYLLEYLGQGTLNKFIDLFYDNRLNELEVRESFKMLPKKLKTYQEVLSGLHRVPRTKSNFDTSKSVIFG